jgi:hypothetical protein
MGNSYLSIETKSTRRFVPHPSAVSLVKVEVALVIWISMYVVARAPRQSGREPVY